ncbi:MAG TPA: tetratricopeptide repeat protein [Bacteroidales bacterium]|nr:tetratricopeptide repeat protein [Bacteroidales bacterium]HRZ47866.1 tetratricopeptide repeat protein [Bacteroidales bacterium]
MKKYFLFLGLLILLTCQYPALAQDSRETTLTRELQAHQERDTTRCRLLLELAGAIVKKNPNAAISYCGEAQSLAEKFRVKKSMIEAYNLMGQAWSSMDNIPKSELAYEEAIKLAKEINDSIEIARLIHNYSNVLINSGKGAKALPLLLNAEAINKSIGLKDRVAANQDNLGVIYCIMGDYQEALNYHLKALAFFEEAKDKNKAANCYMNIGNVFNYLNEVDKAREYYEKSLICYKDLGNRMGMAQVNLNIGISYLNHSDKSICFNYLLDAYEIGLADSNYGILSFSRMNLANRLSNLCDADYEMLRRDGTFRGYESGATSQHELALKFLYSDLELTLMTKNWFSHNFVLYLIGETYYWMRQFDKALPFLHQALAMADTLKNLDKQRLALKRLSQVHESMGRFDSALYYYQAHILIRDSLNNNQKLKEIQRREMQYEFEARERELRHGKEVSDLNARVSTEMLQQKLLLLKTSEQARLLQSKELDLSRKEQEMSHLAYLQKMADLQVVDLENKAKERQLALLGREHELAGQKIRIRSLQRNISYGLILASLIFLLYLFRNIRKQRKFNRRLQALNNEINQVNALLKGSNEELSTTLGKLQQTQAQLIETEKQKEKEAIRRRISQDMHDEISSGLTRIVWLCEMAGRKVAQAEYASVGGVIDRIAESSRAAVERIGEIIWAIDPDRDNLEGFYAYLRTYIMEYFEPTGYKVNVTFPEKRNGMRFNPDVKRTLFAVIKEALHNVVKHAKGDSVQVDFRVDGPLYRILIADNGIGIGKASENNHRNGLKNMRQRMESVGGTFSIVPQEVPGTHILLQGPVAGV